MPRNRDQFLRYGQAQRRRRLHSRTTLSGRRLEKLASPTRVFVENKLAATGRVSKRKKQKSFWKWKSSLKARPGRFRGQPVGDIQAIERTRRKRRVGGQPVGQVRPLR